VPGVSIRGLRKRYGDVAAVEGLDLDVKPGELVALLGPSGCGKTTTLRVVAGFLAPDSGEVWVGDRCLSSPATVIPPERRRMGMIFQSYALWPHMTVGDNVAFPLKIRRTGNTAIKSRVAEMLDLVELGHQRDEVNREHAAAYCRKGKTSQQLDDLNRRNVCNYATELREVSKDSLLSRLNIALRKQVWLIVN